MASMIFQDRTWTKKETVYGNSNMNVRVEFLRFSNTNHRENNNIFSTNNISVAKT